MPTIQEMLRVPKSELDKELARRSLRTFIPWATPTVEGGKSTHPPDHFPEFLQILHDSMTAPQRACFSCCPQSGKSLCLLHALVLYSWLHPGSSSAYVTYGDDIAHVQSRRCSAIAKRAGLVPTGSESHITLANGSVIHFASFGGPIEGFPVTGLLVVDDPYRDRTSAWSEAYRRQVDEKFFGTLVGRIHDTTSIIVCHHRWTPFDLVAKLSEQGWIYRNYPALKDSQGRPDVNGESFAPWLKSKELILSQKAALDSEDIYAFEGEYQGNPLPREGALFDCSTESWARHEYDTLPYGVTYALGMDLAYTESTAADYSVALILAHLNGTYYLVDVLRGKWSDPMDFKLRMDSMKSKYPTIRKTRWDTSAQETATSRLLGVTPVKIPAGFKSYQRSMIAVAAWGAETPTLLVPRSAPWLPAFKAEMTLFTGQDSGGHDDQMIALFSAMEAHRGIGGKPAIVPLKSFTQNEW